MINAGLNFALLKQLKYLNIIVKIHSKNSVKVHHKGKVCMSELGTNFIGYSSRGGQNSDSDFLVPA